MKKLFSRISIKYKIWGAIGLLLALLVTVVLVNSASMSGINSRASVVVDDIQPTVILAMGINADMEQGVRSLGFYMLSSEKVHKQAYLDSMKKTVAGLKKMKASPVIQSDASLKKYVATVESQIKQLEGYQQRLFGYVEQPATNIPGMAFSAANLNPISQQILQNLTAMLQSEEEEEPSADRKKIQQKVNDLRYAWANVMNGARAYLAFRAKASLNEVSLYMGETKRLIKLIKGYGDKLTLDQSEAITVIEKHVARFDANMQKLIGIHGSIKWRTDAYLIRTEIGPLLGSISKQLHSLVSALTAKAKSTGVELQNTVETSISFGWVLLIVSLVLGGLIAWIVNLTVVKPTGRMRDLLQDISQGEGDLTQRCELDSDDELGQASRYFNDMMESLQSMIRDIASTSNEVNTLSSQASNEVGMVSTNIMQSADLAQSAATATEEMSATADEVARNASHAAEEANQIQISANEGASKVGEMSQKAGIMGDQIEQLKRDVDILNDKSKGMLDMVSIINDIANQTNLLALNAAIEAARAGEQGRGFAVVADEVRQLAMKTQESTSQITELINDNLSSNQSLTTVMEKVSDATGSMLGSVQDTDKVITDMTNRVRAMSDMVNQIAAASSEQSVVTNEMASNVESISTAENDNAMRTSDVSGHLHELNGLSVRLSDMVARFKV